MTGTIVALWSRVSWSRGQAVMDLTLALALTLALILALALTLALTPQAMCALVSWQAAQSTRPGHRLPSRFRAKLKYDRG